MNPNQLAAFKNLAQAQQALKSGDKNAAQQFAAQAAQLAPDLEEVWLLMAALASPRGSLAYLEKALKINPNSERAKKGMLWAQGRVQQELEAGSVMAQPSIEHRPEPPRADEKPVAVPAVLGEPIIRPRSAKLHEPIPTPAVVSSVVQNKKPIARAHYSYITLLVIFICLVVAWISWQGKTPLAAILDSSAVSGQEHGPAWAQANISKSDATQPVVGYITTPTAVLPEPTDEPVLVSPTPLFTPLPSEMPALSSTAPALTETGPAPTETVFQQGGFMPTPTETVNPPTEFVPAPTEIILTPGETLVPSETPLPTDIVQEPATPDSGSVEQPSPTPLPTDTAIPFATQYIPPTPIPNSGGSSGGTGRWIDVDLTHQMVYAYEGNTLVNSFLVSTGTWQYPTVTGQYHVYIKYRYKDMSGPGYFLPNVPFTMFFYQGYAIHGTYWHNNFGTPMSHGCVNMSIPDSEWVYNWASVGILVNVHY